MMAFVLGTTGAMAGETKEDKVVVRNAYYGNSFIFVEDGITFSVYPDGEFDFYIDRYLDRRGRRVTFNNGYDYSPYAQYDDYGAVIQVENVPVYYDFYGRVSQIGRVHVTYRNGRVHRMGNMIVYYGPNGFYDYHTGYINVYNRYYVYRPFHRFFVRPTLGLCLVFNRPYRRFYSPVRYTYYRPYRYNHRPAYAKVGRPYKYNRSHKRHGVYRNDKRVTVRSNRNTPRSVERTTTRRAVAQNNRDVSRQRINRRARAANGTKSSIQRSTYKRGRTSSTPAVTRSTRKVTTNSTVSRTPRKRTVTRSTSSYKKPLNRSSHRSITQRSNGRSMTKAPARGTRSKEVKRTPRRSSRSATAQARSTESRRY